MKKPIAYTGQDPFIFISYSHKDEEVVLPLISKLQEKYNVWFDEGIHFGSEWEEEILLKIETCRVFVYIVSKNSLKSSNCEDEILYARNVDKEFFNIIIEEFELPKKFIFRFSKYQSCLLYQYKSIDSALDNIERKYLPFEDCKIKKDELEDKKESYKEELTHLEDEKEPLNLLDYSEINISKEEIAYAERNRKIIRTYFSFEETVNYVIGASFTSYKITSQNKKWKLDTDTLFHLKSAFGAYYEINIIDKIKTNHYLIIEVPNLIRQKVSFKYVLKMLPDEEKLPLVIPLGLDINNNLITCDLAESTNLLVTGSAGSGKSVFIHNLICSLMIRNPVDNVRFILIDPKRVEFFAYKEMPYLLRPIILDLDKCYPLFNVLIKEQQHRLKIINDNKCSNIDEYNKKISNKDKKLPHIFVIFDEYADVVDTDKRTNDMISYLLEKSKCTGVHFIISSQRCSNTIFSNEINKRIEDRIVFYNPSFNDSLRMLGEGGSNKLLGAGDGLVHLSSEINNRIIRVQSPFISSFDIKNIVNYYKVNNETVYDKHFLGLAKKIADDKEIESAVKGSSEEELKYRKVKEWALQQKYISVSRIQRECGVGFVRANRFFNRLIEEGVVSSEKTTDLGNKVN